jgi:hypothetical protein
MIEPKTVRREQYFIYRKGDKPADAMLLPANRTPENLAFEHEVGNQTWSTCFAENIDEARGFARSFFGGPAVSPEAPTDQTQTSVSAPVPITPTCG